MHIADADFYDKVYAGPTHKRNKWSFFTNQGGVTSSVFGTDDHDLHRMRRGALNPYFSKQKIRQLQPRIERVLTNLMRRIDGFADSCEPMTIGLAYAALTSGMYIFFLSMSIIQWSNTHVDVVMEYAFGLNDNRVLAPDFAPGFKEAGEAAAKLGHLVKQMPWLLWLMRRLPDSVQLALNPVMATYIQLTKVCASLIL